jgi:predicted nucleotidyltransferase
MNDVLIKEGPDTVYDKDGRTIVNCSEGPNVGFIIYKITDSNPTEIKYAFSTKHIDGGAGSHWDVRREIEKKEPNTSTDELIQGRIWIYNKIASTYQNKSEVQQYSSQIESIFDELDFDIKEYKWEFGDTPDGTFVEWEHLSKPLPKREMDPVLKKKINDLIQRLHTATPDAKIRIRSLIKKYQKEAGMEEDELDAAIQASQEKLASAKGPYDTIAQARFYQGAIAETKLRVYNKTLDPNLWDDRTLKPEVKEALLKVAEDFYNSTELKGEIRNILFLGSSANYNWTPTSDIDVHIVIDIAEERINEEYARKFMDGLAFKWNTEHDIEVKGHPVEVYLQDVREPNSTPQQARPGASIYSLYDDKWLLEPNPQNIKLDSDKIRKKFQLIKKKIENLIQTEDIEKLKDLMKSIRNYRDAGLAKAGEFSVENIVFKALRHSGDLKRMKDTINTIYDRKLSLPEEGHVLTYKKTKPLNEQLGKPFLVVGAITDDLSIKSAIDYTGSSTDHVKMTNTWSVLHDVRWRYKSKTNTIYWMPHESEPTTGQREEVIAHLRSKYKVINPRETFDAGKYAFDAHTIDEFINEIIDKHGSISNLFFSAKKV